MLTGIVGVVVVCLISFGLTSVLKNSKDVESYRKQKIGKIRAEGLIERQKDCAALTGYEFNKCTDLSLAREKVFVSFMETLSKENLQEMMDKGVE